MAHKVVLVRGREVHFGLPVADKEIHQCGIQQNPKYKYLMNQKQTSEGSPIFAPIYTDVIVQMEKDTLNLHSTFWLNKNKSKEVHVVLSSSHIALCEKGSPDLKYLYCTPINFDLKFQLVYQGENLENAPQNSIPSKVVGFRLMKQGAMTVEFQIVSHNVLSVWLKYLGKMLNQAGFHKLFKPLRKLGKGGFATVYEVERITDGKLFAVKAFAKQATLFSKNESHKLNLLNEIAMMKAIEHPNLIRMEGIFQSENSLYVVLQLLNEGHLHKKINSRGGKFSISQIRIIMEGLMKGLRHLQDKNILHRDIKPENIMLRNEIEPVLVDFGLAAEADAKDYIFYRCGTPGYVAPEVTTLEKGQQITPACDIFSMGVIFHILLTAKPLFEGRKFEQVYQNNRSMKFNLKTPEYGLLDPSALDLLCKMLRVNPIDRITAEQALQHPFLDNLMVEEKHQSTCTTLKNKNNKIF